MSKTMARARQGARELGDLTTRLRALEDMTIGELAELFREVYGEPTRTRNKDYLKKRLRFRLQELACGGLPERAIARIAELGDELPERWRIRRAAKAGIPPPEAPRDPRLPAVGTVLRRIYQGTSHEVTVAVDGFDYAGERFKTLSAIAKRITGTSWNGFVFFGCGQVSSAADTTTGTAAQGRVTA